MLHTLQKLVSAQLQKQAVMIKRTFIERVEPDSKECGQRPRYFSDSVVLASSRTCSDIDDLSDAFSSGEEWPESFSAGRSWDSETTYDDESKPASDSAGTTYAGDSSPADEFSECVGTPSSSLGDDELSWRQLRMMSSSNSSQRKAVARSLSLFQLLPDCASPGSAEVQGMPETTGAQAPQLLTVLALPAPAGQCSSLAPAAAIAAAPVAYMATACPASPTAVAPERAAGAPMERLQRPCAPDARTTVMVRNVPNNYTRERFLALLDKVGLAGLYDFVYLPVDFRTGCGLGYAFVNMVDPSAAECLWRALDGFKRWGVPSKKRCSLIWNDPFQGLEANADRYRNSPVMHQSVPDSCKPIVLSRGVRVAYPAPTKAIKAPRLRK